MQSEPEVGVGSYCSEVSTRGHGACAAVPVPSDTRGQGACVSATSWYPRTCGQGACVAGPVPSDTRLQGAYAAVPWACRDILEHQPTRVGSWRCIAGLEAKTQTRVKILLEREWLGPGLRQHSTGVPASGMGSSCQQKWWLVRKGKDALATH